MKGRILAIVATFLLLAWRVSPAQAIDVLWYAYSGEGSVYRTQMQALADAAHTYPAGSGLRWNVTFFGPGETPRFAAYDVLVTQSSLTNEEPLADYSGLLANGPAIAAARGSRTLITGLDPDFHIVNVPGPVDDGPRGMLVNAVNWAASGSGLGIVALDDEDAQWMFRAGSFLSADVAGFASADFGGPIRIAPGTEDYPVNAGLTTAGLDWGAHTAYSKAMPGYVAIHESLDDPTLGITMVTASQADGATTPSTATYWCDSLLPPLDRVLRLPTGSGRTIPMRFVLLDAAGAVVDAATLSAAPRMQVEGAGDVADAGALRFQRGSGTWLGLVDAGLLDAVGTWTLRAVAPDGASWTIDACEQSVLRE